MRVYVKCANGKTCYSARYAAAGCFKSRSSCIRRVPGRGMASISIPWARTSANRQSQRTRSPSTCTARTISYIPGSPGCSAMPRSRGTESQQQQSSVMWRRGKTRLWLVSSTSQILHRYVITCSMHMVFWKYPAIRCRKWRLCRE